MKNRNRRHGFSMIEVMVAATILVVIVMMLGMLFQQTSVAWRTGLMRSDGYMQLRAFIGAIQRDAGAMIDASRIPQSLLCNNQKQKFSSGEIKFYTMTGTLRTTSSGSLQDFRALNFITYNINGRRTQRRLEPDGTWSEEESSNVLAPPNISARLDKPQVRATHFNIAYQQGTEYDDAGNVISDLNRYPLFLTVETEVTQHGRLYDVGAECSGPDRRFGTGPSDAASKDDIRTWVQQ
ncbi:MAG TPA: prepilin-type N-terminal cleavage/methylation domain-containing protein [Candidatus Latescibacteria bacterium]|nr:prepilin-type N-terminal cleavage/methylation domain-containing protein [Candidatus Latescibacterota bacterium]